MTEYAIPLDQLTGEDIQMPANSIIPSWNDQTLPRVDAARGVFITTRGTEIELADHPVSALIVQRIQQDGKPKIPMIEVTLLGKHKQLEPHPAHEGYQARLKEWEEESQITLLRYLFVVGTKGNPPQEFISQQTEFFPNASDSELKYLWVASRLPDEDMGAFTEAVMGRSLPTAKGLDESAESFRSEG